MSNTNEPPILPASRETRPSPLTDPATGLPVPIADLRAEFERLSRQTTRDRDAERAFIESKIDLIRGDHQLTDMEKESAIRELLKKLDRFTSSRFK
jgi:hypothetical protein